MSHQGDKGGQDNNSNKSKFVNPYAKRKHQTPTSNRNGSHNHSSRNQSQNDSNASFSQLFGNETDVEGGSSGVARIVPSMTTTGTSAQQNQTVSGEIGSSIDSNVSVNTNTVEDLALQPHVLQVSTKQRGNGILRYMRNVPFAYAKIVPDYIVGPNRCALFLSFKYHNLHPNYVHRRIAELKSDFDLRLLLCLVDVEDNAAILLILNKLCCVNNMTLILSWSEQEAARYLETFKAFESKDASTIQKKKQVTFEEQIADTLSCIRSVHKTDAATLTSQFGNLKNIMTASIEDIRLCPGIGEKKAKRLFEAFNKPFSKTMAKKRKAEQEMKNEAANDEADESAIIEELDHSFGDI